MRLLFSMNRSGFPLDMSRDRYCTCFARHSRHGSFFTQRFSLLILFPWGFSGLPSLYRPGKWGLFSLHTLIQSLRSQPVTRRLTTVLKTVYSTDKVSRLTYFRPEISTSKTWSLRKLLNKRSELFISIRYYEKHGNNGNW